MAPSFSSEVPVIPLRHGVSIAVLEGRRRQGSRAPSRGLRSPAGTSRRLSCREAALSELREETGITAEIAGFLDTIEIDALDKCGETLVPVQRILCS